MNLQDILEVSKYYEVENFDAISKNLDTNIIEAINETKKDLLMPNKE